MTGSKADCIKFLVDAPDGMYSVKEWHERRSLDANAYYWALLTELAAAIRIDKDELHRILLSRYSIPLLTPEGRHVTVTLRSDIPTAYLPGYWIVIRESGKFTSYLRIKGSSDMDTKEFSRLLDGLIGECNEVGISTLLPAEVERLKGYVKTK